MKIKSICSKFSFLTFCSCFVLPGFAQSQESQLGVNNNEEKPSQISPGIRTAIFSSLNVQGRAKDGYYIVLVEQDGQWIPKRITGSYPVRSSLSQEIFFASKDLTSWYLAVPSERGLCTPSERESISPYTICNTKFGTYSGLGTALTGLAILLGNTNVPKGQPRSSDDSEIKKTVLAIPEKSLIEMRNQADIEIAAAAEANQRAIEEKNRKLAMQKAAENERIAAEQARIKQSISENIAKMENQPRGSEDSCKRVIRTVAGPGGAWVVGQKDPQHGQIECQLNGLVEIESLAKAGWIVVSKNRDNQEMVTDYLIRKGR